MFIRKFVTLELYSFKIISARNLILDFSILQRPNQTFNLQKINKFCLHVLQTFGQTEVCLGKPGHKISYIGAKM